MTSFPARPSFFVRMEPAKGGFVDKLFMRKFVDAETKSRFQAAGEAMRYFAKRRLPAAKRARMSASQQKEQQLPPDRPMFAANPAPNMPAIRLKPKGKKTPLNLSRPWYSVDNMARPRMVLVGPPRVGGASDKQVPRILEQGGRVRKNSRMRRRRVGHGGEIRTDGRPSRTNRLIETDFGATITATYIRLRTVRQVRRANLIQRDLFRPPTFVSHPPRRYMARIAKEAMRSTIYTAKVASLMRYWRETGRGNFKLRVAA